MIACAFWLVVPSVGAVLKHLGGLGLLVYAAAVVAALWAIRSWVLPRLEAWLSEKAAIALAAVTLVGVIVAFLCLHQQVSAPRPGHGSDRNEALNLATGELLYGRYPYYPKTHLGNPISPLPGSLLLAAPFVWLGDSAYQAFFWLAVLFVVVRRQLRDPRRALLLVWAALALSPAIAQEILTGGDLLPNSIYVLVFVLALLHRAERGSAWLYALLLGVGLSSRANFLVLLPLVLSALAQRAGWGRALKLTAVSCATLGIVTVPFFLASPEGFSPLHTLHMFEAASSGPPWFGSFVLFLDAGLAVALAFLRPSRTDAAFLGECALVLAVPVVFLAAVLGVRTGVAGLASLGYGVCSLFFGLLSCTGARPHTR